MRKRILWIQTGGTFSCEDTKSGLAPQSSEEQAGKKTVFHLEDTVTLNREHILLMLQKLQHTMSRSHFIKSIRKSGISIISRRKPESNPMISRID